MDSVSFLELILVSTVDLFDQSGRNRLSVAEIIAGAPDALRTALDSEIANIVGYDGMQDWTWALTRALTHWELLDDDNLISKSEVLARLQDIGGEG